MSSSIYSFDGLSPEHIMLNYQDHNQYNNNIIDYINEALGNGYLCVYASVAIGNLNTKNNSVTNTLSSKIINYDDNIKNGNLRLINFKPYYESALLGDLTLFQELKSELEHTLYKRPSEGKKDRIIVFADAVGYLSYNGHFQKSIDLEKWWHQVHSDWIKNNQWITVICPHPNYAFTEGSLQDITNKIGVCHTTTINLDYIHSLRQSHNLDRQNTDSRQIIRILIAEPEPDLCDLYTEYLNEMDIEVVVVENGRKCLEYLLDSNGNSFDMVIVDSHLHDIHGFEVVKKIREKMPKKRIIFSTTNSSTDIINDMDLLEIDKNDILLKPFNFSKLLPLIKTQSITRPFKSKDDYLFKE